MEVSSLKVAREQLRNAVVVVYSLIVVTTIIPGINLIPNLLTLPYFLLVPGYFVTLLLRDAGTSLERLFYSIAWSMALLLSVYSINSITPGNQLPISLVIPLVTLVLLAYDHFHRPSPGA